MSKKLIFVLIIFLLAITALLYAAVLTTKSSVSKSQISHPKPSSALYTKLSLAQDPQSIASGQNIIVQVVLDATTKPGLIQLEIGYDPDILFQPYITVGNYFVNPQIVLENIDYKNGRISYALQSSAGSISPLPAGEDEGEGRNIVATLNFTTIARATPQKTDIYFLPKTSVKGGGEVLRLEPLTGTIINLQPSLFILQASPSAIITPFQTQITPL